MRYEMNGSCSPNYRCHMMGCEGLDAQNGVHRGFWLFIGTTEGVDQGYFMEGSLGNFLKLRNGAQSSNLHRSGYRNQWSKKGTRLQNLNQRLLGIYVFFENINERSSTFNINIVQLIFSFLMFNRTWHEQEITKIIIEKDVLAVSEGTCSPKDYFIF